MFKTWNKQHTRPADSKRDTVMPERVSVDIRVKGDCKLGTAWCGVSGLVNLWSTVFETSVNAVSISSNRTKQTVDRATSPEY